MSKTTICLELASLMIGVVGSVEKEGELVKDGLGVGTL